MAVPATSLSVGKTLLLLAALFEKLFTKMLQAVKGDPQAFSKLTAYSFLEKGVKINKLTSGKRQEPFDCTMGGCHRPGKGRSKRGFGQDSPEPAPLSSVPVNQCGFPWKPSVVRWYPRGHSQTHPASLAPAGEGASWPPRLKKNKAQEKLPRHLTGTKNINSPRHSKQRDEGSLPPPQNTLVEAGSIASTALLHTL